MVIPSIEIEKYKILNSSCLFIHMLNSSTYKKREMSIAQFFSLHCLYSHNSNGYKQEVKINFDQVHSIFELVANFDLKQ